MSPRLKRRVIRFSIPGEASDIFNAYIHRLRHFYANDREFCESVIAYALWCEREHHLTGPSFSTRESRQKMWDEIIADFGKPKKSGSFFEHRLEEIAAGIVESRSVRLKKKRDYHRNYARLRRRQTGQLEQGSEEHRKKARAYALSDSTNARTESNRSAKVWRLRDPLNRAYTFRNLNHFVRNNPGLFAPEDVRWVIKGGKDEVCRATRGLASLSDRRGTSCKKSWKGWTWNSQVERLLNKGKDLLNRNVGLTQKVEL